MQTFTDEEFISAWYAAKCSPSAMHKMTGMPVRSIYKRRKALSVDRLILNTIAAGPYGTMNSAWQDVGVAYKRENIHSIDSGSVIVFSDAHWWPGQPKSVSHLALLETIKALKPKLVIANGDIFDGARVSRHAPMGWVKPPTVKEELDICEEYLHEIHLASNPKQCGFYWNIGNHDQRFDRMLAQNSPEYEGVTSRLEDRFPAWEFGWSVKLNNNVMVKHRYHNGIHAGYNNALKSGMSIITGHLHRLLVTPWADYNGRRWGVDTGTLSNPLGPQFEYGENNPTPHTSGFAVLTFKDGMLLPPELCEVINDRAYFRGQEIV